MEYRVLGKLEVLRDGLPVDLGAFRQRALLALLLTAPNAVFSTDRILNELWGEDGGVDKQNALWVYVSGLRTALEPERAKRTEGSVLLTRAPGYLLETTSADIDARRFERLVAEGRALGEIDPEAASLVLGESLAMWRGRAFEDFTYEPFAQAEIARLEELRLEAVELRLNADLERGLSRELVSELESLVRQHPLNERLAGQLMLALYRSARQADALRTYQLLRARLVEELGIEPSAPVRNLEQRIVIGDPTLEGRTSNASGPQAKPGLAIRGYELRERIGSGATGTAYRAYQPAVGREVAVTIIRSEVANDPAFVRRFNADAQAVATLEHPHIVPLYDYWREPDAAYLVTRLMHGGSLASRLESGALGAAEAMSLVDQVASAMQTARRAGVRFGDIGTADVLLDDEGNAYLSNLAMVSAEPASEHSAEIRDLGLLAARSLTGHSGDVGSLRGDLPKPVADVVDRATGADSRVGYTSVAEMLGDLREALTGSPRPNPPSDAPIDNPYKGLRSFDTVDALDFFGRERLVERLIARLGRGGRGGRFVAVVGPSGSGKSSAVRAGMLPAVRRGAVPLSGSWFTVEMSPAPHPFEQLEEALLGVALESPPSLLEQLAGVDGVERAIERVLPDDGSQLLLVIDQLEELFTQVDGTTSQRFIQNLVSAVNDEQSRLRVVVTLRADFYDRPLQHRGLGELLRHGTEVITPMTPHELERAITLPAAQRAVAFEPALVAELMREVTNRPGALPLLQYTLTELFEARHGNRVTHADYERLGGVSGALVKRADGLLTSLGDDADEVARQVFLRLVTINDGDEDTRRRVLRSELDGLDVDRQLLHSVLETFGRHRLLSFDRDPVTRSPTVEISHEALLTEWTRLRDWIDGAREDMRVQRRLADALREWDAADRADSYLLRGGVLEQVHGWSTTTSMQLSESERVFVDASIAEREREIAEARLREARASEAERRQRQRGRQLVAVGLVTLLVTGLALFGTLQWRSAVDAKREVDDLLAVENLVAASRSRLDQDPELSLLLAMQSVSQTVHLGYATEDAVDAVHFALQELGVQYDVDETVPVAARPGSRGRVGVYALSPHELMRLAESSTTRGLTDDECRTFLSVACPEPVDVPDQLAVRGGFGAYADDGPRPMEGTTVTLFTGQSSHTDGFLREFIEFKERTGINVVFAPPDAENVMAFEPGRQSRRPDVYMFQHDMPSYVDDRALAVSEWVDPAQLRYDFGEYLLGFGTGDAGVRAIPMRVDVKGVVFYPKAAFEAAGYDVPNTWGELVELSDRIVTDGGTPWCFGFESGTGSGWPGTDLIESLVLRVGGVDIYDDWTRGRTGFTSPAVREAAHLANELVFTPGYVRGGPAAISDSEWSDQLSFMAASDSLTGAAEPQCWLLHQAAYMLYFVPSSHQAGADIDFFVLPPTNPERPTPMTATVAFAAPLNDRPEVREFMQFVASPEWGQKWAAEPGEDFTSPNVRFDVSSYGDGDGDPAEVATRSRLAELAKAALMADAVRIDASDLMPPEIGGWTDERGPGAFWRAMLDWVDGTRSIDQAFEDIDAEWAELRRDTAESTESGP